MQGTVGLADRLGKPIAASSREGQLASIRRLFTYCQEWEWRPAASTPCASWAPRAASPRCSGPNSSVIADDIWAKLLSAGLNLGQDDLPVTTAGHFYPIELVRAITGVADQVLARDAVCLLDTPPTKPARLSPSPSTRSSARPSTRGRPPGRRRRSSI